MENNMVQIIIAAVIILIALVASVIGFIKLPKDKKINNVKEWLKYAVSTAEKELGSGTGQLKLRAVYDMATKQFPWITQVVTFAVFSTWVDEALDWMNEQLSKNKAIETYVKNED